MSDGKIKPSLSKYNNKSSYPFLLNNKDQFGLDDNEDLYNNFTNKENSPFAPSPSNYINHKNNTKNLMRNYSMNSFISHTLQNEIENSIVTNSNNVLLIDNNKSTKDRLNPRNAIRINKIKDDYINFLQRQYEDKSKINFSLDLNNKELLQKCNDLIQDNILLNKVLQERTNKLKKVIQDNKYMKMQLDKSLLNVEKNEQKIGYYEEQLKLFQNNNENYQKIIRDLKEQNDQLNSNINQMKISNEEKKKEREKEQQKMEEEYNNKIEDLKNKIDEEYKERIEELNKKINKINDLMEEIKILKEKDNELQEELKKKDNIIELMYKDNEKLVNENNLKNMEIEQKTKQINDLNQIIKHKENLIITLKSKMEEKDKEKENDKLFINKSNSPSSIKLENNKSYHNSDYINANLTQLLSDNEENKVKLEYLNDKIKNINDIELKYNQLIGKKNKVLTNNTSFIVRNSVNSSKDINNNNIHSIYLTNNDKNDNKKNNKIMVKSNSQNSSLKNFIKKKNDFQEIRLHYINNNSKNNTYTDKNKNIILNKNTYSDKNKNITLNKNKNVNLVNFVRKPILVNTSLHLKPPINISINIDNKTKKNNIKRNETSERIINEYKDNVEKKSSHHNPKNRVINVNKSNSITIDKKSRIFEIDLKNNKDKKDKSSDKINLMKARNDNNNTLKDIQRILKNLDKKKYERESEEKAKNKENLRYMGQQKSYTYNINIPNINLSLDTSGYSQESKNQNKEIFQKININLNKNKIISYYLFGIDRNDCLHIFDINNRKWVGKKKILDLNLDDKSNSFKKDYQYEGTLLYNTLEGVYILTGEKTDTLYYYNSKTNMISKICKFKNSHDNGSIMYDKNNKCLYVFGGKKTKSCEYYSFKDKKIYKLPDLTIDRANASFIISNNKIYGFFGFSYINETYAKTIEYIDYNKKDKWVVLNDIIFLKNDILFDIESVATMYYKSNKNKILIYCGIQGEEEEFITEYYLLYDSKINTMDKINKWNLNQYKYLDNFWKNYTLKNNDPKGFHFAKNSKFISLPKKVVCDGYNENDLIDILIDYKNNVHFILQEKEKIDIYRGEI